MVFHPFEVGIPHIAYACLGGFVVFFGMFSLFIREKLYIGEACWAFLFGVIIGPYGADVFNPRSWGNGNVDVVNTITLEFTRVVLAIGVFAIGVELPKAYMQKHWKSLLFLLVPVMTWGWFVSAGLIFALIPGLSFLSSLVVAACLTPTDPILAAAVVGGKYADKHVPAHLRHLLAAESGCNDGAAFPFLFIGLYLVLDDTTGAAIKDWFLELWLYQILLGAVFGALVGLGFRYLMKFCERKDLIDRQSYVAQYVSLALLTIGTTTLLGSDDLLAAFTCGTAFAWDGFFNRQTEESVFSSVIDLLFNVAAFVYVGAWMPFSDFSDATLTLSVWRLIVIGILVLLLRRLPVMIALYKWIPDVKTFREAIFSGHFGPMGIGAIFISTLAVEKLEHPHDPPENQQQILAATIQPIVAFMVLLSIAVHGLSIPFFSLGRRVHSLRTWSRHPTHDATPEWANQMRHVQQGEEIVINRDDAIERGEYTPEHDEKRSASTTLNQTHAPKEKDMAESPTSSQSRSAEAMSTGEVQTGDQEPPDGAETLQEWKEGPHKVVERRAGPGEEVEVEVQRNAFAEGEETTTSVIRGEPGHVKDAARDYIHKLQHAPHEAEKELERTRQHVKEGVREVEGRAMQKADEVAGAASAISHPDEGDDEGWTSDPEPNNGDPGPSNSAAAETSVSASRSPDRKVKGPKPKGGLFAAGRRRPRIRRRGSSSQSQPMDDDEKERGRTHATKPVVRLQPITDEDKRGSLRSPRLDHLRSYEGRRTASPSRSVRFADDDDSEPRTPSWRTPLDTPSPGTPRAGTPPPGEEGDVEAHKTHVSFDLSRFTRP